MGQRCGARISRARGSSRVRLSSLAFVETNVGGSKLSRVSSLVFIEKNVGGLSRVRVSSLVELN